MSVRLIEGGLSALETMAAIGPRDEITDAEREQLRCWPGWGVYADVLHPGNTDERTVARRDRLQAILTPDQLSMARRSTPMAFYTPPAVTDAAWRILTGLGFDGGRILEPGCGHGNFMAATPDDLRDKVRWLGIERDQPSARIAQLLHRDVAEIIAKPMEAVPLGVDMFDAVLANVPFEKVAPYDPLTPANVELTLHNYFLWKALRALRGGGIMVAITSRYTLDSEDVAVRGLLAKTADLIGAVLLPTGWERSYGTDAVAHLLVFRKRMSGEEPQRYPRWQESHFQGVAGSRESDYWLNEYWSNNPDQVLGELRGTRGYANGVTLESRFAGDPAAMMAAIADAANRVAEYGVRHDLTWVQPERSDLSLVAEEITKGPDGRAIGSLHVDGGVLVQITADGPRPASVRSAAIDVEIRALIQIRDAGLALVRAEADPDAPDAHALRSWLMWLYTRYVTRYGLLNRCEFVDGRIDPETNERTIRRKRPDAHRVMRDDPDFALVIALEAYDDDTATGSPAPLLRGRFNRPPVRKERADDPAEAVALCLDELGQLSEFRVAQLLDVPLEHVAASLGTLAYRDPETGVLVTADEYLSGHVRRKLRNAERAERQEPGMWERNIEALRAVLPRLLTPAEISIGLGSPVLDASDVRDFLLEVVRGEDRTKLTAEVRAKSQIKVSHTRAMSTWHVQAPLEYRRTPLATDEHGTRRVNAYRLVEMACNGQTPVVKDELEDGTKVRNTAETMLACTKQEALQARFEEWVWEDPERAERLSERYNWTFNSEVARTFTGDYLTFPGLVEGFVPRPSQRSFVARALVTPTALCGHTMGAGKTATMGLLARTLKRLGLVRTPIITVPGHLLEQVSSEIGRLFPGARILMASSEDVSRQRKQLFAARVATGDYDLVVMTHNAFTAIKLPREAEAEYLRNEIHMYEEALLAEAAGGGRDDDERRRIKQIGKKIDQLEAKLKKLLDAPRAMGSITFDLLGARYVMVDEQHRFKNRGVATRASGFSMASSQRATHLDMVLWWLRQQPGATRYGSLYTGTPVSNSIAETYILLMYLAPDRMEELGIAQFDAFAGQFIRWVTKAEVAPDGGTFRVRTSPDVFKNVPELRYLLGAYADILGPEDLNLDVPEVDAETEVVEPTDEVLDGVMTLVRRADQIRQGLVHPRNDNMLRVCTHGRQLALDSRLVGLESEGKLERCAEKVLTIWREFHGIPVPDAAAQQGVAQDVPSVMVPSPPAPKVAVAQGSLGGLFAWAEAQERKRAAAKTSAEPPPAPAEPEGPKRAPMLQVVFCDLGTPKKIGPDVYDGQTYGRLKAQLVAGGMDPRRIKFVQSAKSHAEKSALFSACRAGEVDVIVGSSEGLGEGTNIQTYLYAYHHLDAPWKPAQVLQRKGRAVRPGNTFKRVREITYIAARTFDAYIWQLLERKARFIMALFNGKLTSREIEDVGEIVLSYAEIKALATGNTLLLELADAESRYVKMRTAYSAHARSCERLEWDAKRWRQEASELRAAAESLQRMVGFCMDFDKLAHIGDETIEATGKIGDAIAAAFRELCVNYGDQRHLGRYRGIQLTARTQRVVSQRWEIKDGELATQDAWYFTLDLEAHGHRERLEVIPGWLRPGNTHWMVERLDHLVDGGAEKIVTYVNRADELMQQADAAVEQAARPFRQMDDFLAARDRFQDLKARMEAAAKVDHEAMDRQSRETDADDGDAEEDAA